MSSIIPSIPEWLGIIMSSLSSDINVDYAIESGEYIKNNIKDIKDQLETNGVSSDTGAIISTDIILPNKLNYEKEIKKYDECRDFNKLNNSHLMEAKRELNNLIVKYRKKEKDWKYIIDVINSKLPTPINLEIQNAKEPSVLKSDDANDILNSSPKNPEEENNKNPEEENINDDDFNFGVGLEMVSINRNKGDPPPVTGTPDDESSSANETTNNKSSSANETTNIGPPKKINNTSSINQDKGEIELQTYVKSENVNNNNNDDDDNSETEDNFVNPVEQDNNSPTNIGGFSKTQKRKSFRKKTVRKTKKGKSYKNKRKSHKRIQSHK
jgi:hypothetical protein